MTRSLSRPMFAVGFSLAVLAYVGCTRTYQTANPSDKSRTAPTGDAAHGPESDEAPPANAKLFADWKGLQAAIVITGEMDGYLDPCGCTEGQLGGLGRRFDLIERMKAQAIPVAKIDLGSLTKEPLVARGGLPQAKVKFETALTALTAMGYDALALASEDLKFGIVETLTIYLNRKDKLAIVAANVEPDETFKDAFAGTIRPSTIAQAGPYKLGITAVVDPASYEALKDADRTALKVTPPESALGPVLGDLEEGSDYQILMVQGPPALAKSLGERFPGFDVVVATSEYADPDDQPKLINGGKTRLVNVGKKGKYVGVIGLLPGTGGTGIEARYERISLRGNRYHNAEPMRALIDEEMQVQLKTLGVVENYSRHANLEAPSGATYVGADGCKSCHPNTFKKWSGTSHAKAFETLVHNPKDPRRKRTFDAECISCHTTGFTYESGWVSAEKTPFLEGNQCENCHGPASKHVEQPDLEEFSRSLARTAESADKSGMCLKCHDEDNSPHFNFASYWKKVAHEGLDSYGDPKTHKGMTPAEARAAH